MRDALSDIKELLNKMLQITYRSTMQNAIDIYDEVLKAIPETTEDIWGKTIIKLKEIAPRKYEQKEKKIETIRVDLLFSKKALRCVQSNSSAFSNLITDVTEHAVEEANMKKKMLLLNQVRKELDLKATDEEIYKVLWNILNETYNLQEYSRFHKLCNWRWLSDLNDKENILFDEGDFYRASFVLYGNYMFDDKLKDEIKKRLKV